MSSLNVENIKPLSGYFVSNSHVDTYPNSELGVSIEWHRLSIEDASEFQALNFEIVATTHAPFAAAVQSLIDLAPHSDHVKPVLRLDLEHESTWTGHLDNLLANHLPVRCFGPITTRGAHIADHIFFSTQNSSLYDILLLKNTCSAGEVRQRFRQWSIHLHPDRFELKKSTCPGLIRRLHTVYDRVCEAYRVLNNPYKRALHDYWLDMGDKDRAITLDEGQPIAELKRISEVPCTRTELITALRCTQRGHWDEAVAKLSSLLAADPKNRNLKNFVATLSQISSFINQERGNTSLN